jgi:hypothetical protein
VADATGTPARVAVDGTYAYWSESLGGAIMRAPKDGSGSPSLVAASTEPLGLVVVGPTVYWATTYTTDQTIHEAPASGGPATDFATVYLDPALSQGVRGALGEIATDGSNLFVANQESPYRVPILADGGAGAPIALSQLGLPPTDITTGFTGEIAFRANDFCAVWFSINATVDVNCTRGNWAFPEYESSGPIVLPSCGLAYVQGKSNTSLLVRLVADRDFYPNPTFPNGGYPPPLTLNSNPVVGPLVTDGLWIYFFETMGNIRKLPIP